MDGHAGLYPIALFISIIIVVNMLDFALDVVLYLNQQAVSRNTVWYKFYYNVCLSFFDHILSGAHKSNPQPYLTMDERNTLTNYGKGLYLAHLNVRSMFGGKKFDMLKLQIELSGFDVLTLYGTATTDNRNLGLTPAVTICRSNLSLSLYPILHSNEFNLIKFNKLSI